LIHFRPTCSMAVHTGRVGREIDACFGLRNRPDHSGKVYKA
jgi:hypothetical protein